MLRNLRFNSRRQVSVFFLLSAMVFTFLFISKAHAAVEYGIAANYPGDVGIENAQGFIFRENFEEASINAMAARWEDISNQNLMSFNTDKPSTSAGSKSVFFNGGAHLYRRLQPGYDQLYVRFYVKFDPVCSNIHHFVHMGGYNPTTTWPQGGAGIRPAGNERWTTGIEPNGTSWAWDFYSYWMHMRSNPDTRYWGNSFSGRPSPHTVTKNEWISVEFMVKMNNPVTAYNGEQAFWINGEKKNHLGLGVPRGEWIWDGFYPNSSCTPSGQCNTNGSPTPCCQDFEGFQWRNTSALNINFLWLLHYVDTNPSCTVKFDDVVVATQYIGPIVTASGGGGDTPPPSSGGDSTSSGGSGCGFVKDINGKGQRAKGEGLIFAMTLILALAGIALAKRIFRLKGFILYKYISVFLTITLVTLLSNNYLNAENTDRTKAEAACQDTDVILCENWEDGDSVGWLDFSTTASFGGPVWGGISCLIGNCTYQNAGYNSNSALEAYLTAPNNNGTIYPSHNIAGLGVDDGVYIRWKAYWSPGFEWNTNGNKHLFVWMGAGPTNTQIQEAGFFFRPLHDDPGGLTGNVPIENIKFARPGIHQYCAGTDAIQRPEWATICNNVGGDVWYMPNVQGQEMFTVASGRWYDFELYLRPNPLGQSFGGAIKLWVDGTLITDYTDVSLRHANTNAFIDQVELSSYWGGGGVYPTHPDQYVLYDNIIVSKNCIGCSNSGGNTPPSSGGDTTSSNGDSSASGGSGCGFVKEDNSNNVSKSQSIKVADVGLMLMLIISFIGISIIRRIAKISVAK